MNPYWQKKTRAVILTCPPPTRTKEQARQESVAKLGFFMDDDGHIVIDTSITGPRRLQDISAVDTVVFRMHTASTCRHSLGWDDDMAKRMKYDWPVPLYNICEQCKPERQ